MPASSCEHVRLGCFKTCDALDNNQDPNDMRREWKLKFLNVVDTCSSTNKACLLKKIPMDYFRVKKRMHERNIMKLKAIRSKNPQDWGEFKRLRNNVNSDIRIVKESYYKQSFTEKNYSRRTWQTINELTSRKSNTPSIKELIVDGVSINKSTDLANAFDEHFSTVGPKLANQIPSAANITVTKVVLNILISLTKDSVLPRQIAVKYFYY